MNVSFPSAGDRLGPYEIRRLIGRGGMGEVYRAHDTTLHRDVALKVLPERYRLDAARIERFDREARVLASLNHPNIATLHGRESSGNIHALVMELVEGETLAERLREGPLPLDRSVRVASQIVEALVAAHAHGIVHRDLKPDNVKIRPDGTVKVLDFGLAKAREGDDVQSAAEATMTLASEQAPGRLGTAPYMSPEQARGLEVDARSDVWSFGCVLYEMLTGQQAFTGQTPADVIVSVLGAAPDLSRLPAATPARIRRLLEHCLEKDRDRRLQHIGDARFELEESLQQRSAAQPVRWRWVAVAAGAVAIGFAAHAVVSRSREASSRQGAQPVAIPLTSYEGTEWGPSLSPDGSQVAFAWSGPRQENEDIFIKLVGPGEPHQLTTHPARDNSPAWSPDSQSIAFLRWGEIDSDADIMLVPALGNAAERRIASIRVRPVSQPLSRLAWTPDSKWLAVAAGVSPDERGIWLISVDGQQRRRLTETPGPADAGVGDIMPVFSRDGRHLAFVRERSAGANSLHVLPLSVDIMPAGAPVTVSDLSPRSHVLGLAWAEHDRALIFSTSPFLATQSRLHRLALTPDRLRAADGPRVLSFGDQATNLTVSESGRIVYTAHSRDSALARLDLTQPHPVPQPPGVRPSTFDEHTPAYSRDGTRIAFASTRTGTEELWVSNVDGTGLRQVTFIGGAQCANPQWSPIDDDLILFNSRQHGSSDLFVLHLSSGRYERLTSDAADDAEARWSRDGRSIYFASNRSGTLELWKMPAVGGRPVQITRGGGVAGSEGSDGFIYYAKGLPSPTSIWRVPAAGGEAAPVVEGLSYSTNFVLGSRGLYLMARGESSYDTAIDYVDLASRSRKRLTSIGKRWWFGLALSPDEKSLLYSIVESSDANLMLVDKAW